MRHLRIGRKHDVGNEGTLLEQLIVQSLAYYLRSTPFEYGRYRLMRYGRPLVRRVGGTLGSRRLRTNEGFLMELNLTDWIPQDIFLTGTFEPSTTSLIKSLVRGGDTVVDVGAHIGYFTLLLAECVGHTGRVLAYEPAAIVREKLQKNINLNDCPQVSVHSEALSDRDGSAKLFLAPENNTGLSSFREPRDCIEVQEVATRRFDSIFTPETRISLVKIDVEGAEAKVIRGMKRYLEVHRPHLIVEITDKFLIEMGEDADGLLSLLKSYGYRAYVIGGNEPTRLEHWDYDLPGQFNALFSLCISD